MNNKFIVINKKSIIKFLFVGSVIFSICISNIRNFDILETNSKNRLLPIYSVETDKKQVAITFDCAWGADDIPAIIEVLNKNNINAIFFVVGDWVKKYPNAIKALSDANMEIRKSYF